MQNTHRDTVWLLKHWTGYFCATQNKLTWWICASILSTIILWILICVANLNKKTRQIGIYLLSTGIDSHICFSYHYLFPLYNGYWKSNTIDSFLQRLNKRNFWIISLYIHEICKRINLYSKAHYKIYVSLTAKIHVTVRCMKRTKYISLNVLLYIYNWITLNSDMYFILRIRMACLTNYKNMNWYGNIFVLPIKNHCWSTALDCSIIMWPSASLPASLGAILMRVNQSNPGITCWATLWCAHWLE